MRVGCLVTTVILEKGIVCTLFIVEGGGRDGKGGGGRVFTSERQSYTSGKLLYLYIDLYIEN